MEILNARSFVHNEKVRDRDGSKSYRFEVFAIKEEAMAFLMDIAGAGKAPATDTEETPR